MIPAEKIKRSMVWLMAALCALLVSVRTLHAADDASNLKTAIKLFDEGKYLAAQELLLKVKPEGLNEAQRTQRNEYLDKVQDAINQAEKAERDLDAGEAALKAGDLDKAEELLKLVTSNKYASEDTRNAAYTDLKTVGARRKEMSKPRPAEAVTPPAPAPVTMQPAREAAPPPPESRSDRARALTRQGNDATDAGRYDEARRFFNDALDLVPGYPEAVTGLERLAQHEQVEGGPPSLLQRMHEQQEIAWQRTVASFRDAERAVREHVMNQNFDQARQALLLAEQTVEAGRQYADPLSRYETLRGELEALRRYVNEEEEMFNAKEVAKIRAEAERERLARIRQIDEERQRQIDSLMRTAVQHRKDRDYERALEVLRQVLAIDPRNERAKDMMDDIQDRLSYQKQRVARHDRDRQVQELFTEVEEGKVPNVVELTYPKNWLEIISRETRGGTRRVGERDIALRTKLDQPIPIRFQDEPLDQVFAQMREKQDVNLSVVWNDLERAGVKRDTRVTLDMPKEVAFKTAIDQVLEQVTRESPLAYRVRDGVLTVATKEKLDQDTVRDVYDVHDLLMEVPDFVDAPEINLENSTEPPARDTAFAGDHRGKGRHHKSWAGDDDDDTDDKSNRSDRQRRVDELIALIKSHVSPENWDNVRKIDEFNGQLVVTQTSAAQEEIADLLGKLRAQAAVQVAVEARFLTVQSNYLEEMGMDLDIILNSGNAGYDILGGGRAGPLLDPTYGNRLLVPRQFSRLGFTPASPGVGQPFAPAMNALPGGIVGPNQPYVQPGFVPRTGSNFIGGPHATPIPVLSNVIGLTDPALINSDLPGSFAGDPNRQPTFNAFGSVLDNIQVDFLLRATQADSRTTLMTAPRLTLFNGQRAWVAVVNQQSFVSTLMPVVAAGAAAQMPQIGNISTGAVLDVQAIVSADRRYVCMTLRPGVGRLIDLQTFLFSTGPVTGVGASGFVQLPSITRQVLKTTVCIPDNGTLLLGGQKLAGEFEVEAGVPILSKIPVLKRAYSSRTLVKDEQVLLILVKPKILIQKEQEEEALAPFATTRG
ncbi:MAG TPA: hypothetical protein VGM03_05125 [Phycisphaerae bacterium]